MSAGLMLNARSGLQAATLAVVVLVVALVQGMAGEPIIVGKEKPKTDAVRDTKFGKELSKPWEKVSPDAPINGLIFPSIIPRADSWDPKNERKRKLQEREKKNWMSVLPGELQQEDEEKNFLGVREYDLEQEDDSDNLMFRDLRSERNSGQGTSRTQSRSASQRENQNTPQRDAETLDRELAARRAARLETQSSQIGAHTASELNFKGVFGASPIESKRSSDLTLRDVLGSSEPQASKSQQALREEFKAFLHGQPSQGAGGFSDPVHASRTDFTRQPLNPTIGRAPETRNDTFGGQTPFTPQRQANPFAQGSFNNSAFSQQTVPGFPTPSYAPTPPPTARPYQPPPNSGVGMNSLGGHRR